MLLGKTRAQGSHGFQKTRCLRPQNVQLPLADNRPPRLGHRPPGTVKPEQYPTLFEQNRLGRIHILWLLRCRSRQNPPAEGNHPSSLIQDRKHQPVAKTVVHPARLRLERQARRDHLLFRESAPLSPIQSRRPSRRGVAQTKSGNPFVGNFPFLEIGPGRFGQRVLVQQIPPMQSQRGVDLAQSFPFRPTPPVAPSTPASILLHRHPHPLGQPPHRRRKIQAFHHHDKTEHIPAGSRTEAFEELLVGMDVKRRRLLLFEGAQPTEIRAHPLQLHVGARHLHQIACPPNLFNRVCRETHPLVLSTPCQPTSPFPLVAQIQAFPHLNNFHESTMHITL